MTSMMNNPIVSNVPLPWFADSAQQTTRRRLNQIIETEQALDCANSYITLLFDMASKETAPWPSYFHERRSREYGYSLSACDILPHMEIERLRKELGSLERNDLLKKERNNLDKRVLSAFLDHALADHKSDDPEQEAKINLSNAKKVYNELINHGALPDTVLDLVTRKRPFFCGHVHWQVMVRPYVAALLQYGWLDVKNPGKITKNEWLEAISITSAMMSELGTDIEDAFYEFDADWALQCNSIKVRDTALSMIISFGAIIHTIHSLAENTAKSRDAQEQVIRSAAEESSAKVTALESQLAEANAKIASLQEKLNAATMDAHSAADKAARELEHDHQEEIRKKDAYIRVLETKLEKIQDEEVDLCAKQAFETTGDNAWQTIDLPKDNILFMGGHQNLTKRLKQTYPGWAFITDDHIRQAPPRNPDCVFFWSDHCSHKLYQNLLARLPDDVEIIYLTSTNQDLLNDEMKKKYWARKEYHSVQQSR